MTFCEHSIKLKAIRKEGSFLKRKRLFLVVLDSLGIGAAPDAALYGDEGSNTLRSLVLSGHLDTPNLRSLGLYNIENTGIPPGLGVSRPIGCFGSMREKSAGKDTTTGHWEIGGLVSLSPMPTYPNGFPKSLIDSFERETGTKTLCNKTYSGTEVIRDYGGEHIKTQYPIVYTSADSVFQIAAHVDVIPVETLYDYCRTARKLLVGEHAVGRVIARPFAGENGNFIRTMDRRDFSLEPQGETMCDLVKKAGFSCISVGKIYSIFAERGFTEEHHTVSNAHAQQLLDELIERDFEGLCFVNLVDFDMLYGHRNDIEGYAKALGSFDASLGEIIQKLCEGDILLITADHGCDPGFPGTDHTREYVPIIAYGKSLKQGVNLGMRDVFSDVAATVCEYFGTEKPMNGTSFLGSII